MLGVSGMRRDSVHARGEACACVCAVSERVRGVLSAGRVLHSTSLSGTIPMGLCQTGIRSFDIHDCGFTASRELGSCNSLTTLMQGILRL